MSRQRRAVSERGATLFVVVLAITMLTGIGLYTVHSSALLARASGNERQAMQTTYLAQLGVLASMSQLATNAQFYVGNSKRTKDGSATELLDDCLANSGINLTQYKVSCAEISSIDALGLIAGAKLLESDSFGTAIDPATNQAPIVGRFLTEMTDVYPGPLIPGFETQGLTYVYAKFTTSAELHPASITGACVQNVMQVAGQHITRAHVIVGPVSLPGGKQ